MNTVKIITIVTLLVLSLSYPVFTQMDSLAADLTWISQPSASAERSASVAVTTEGGEKQNAFPISPTWSTFFGGTGATHGISTLVDASGNVWAAFDTTAADMPTTADAIDRTYNGDRDIMVAKFGPEGGLLYSTYLGGSAPDGDPEITQDEAGYIYLAGYSFSPEFITTANALDRDLGGGRDGVIVKLDSNGQLVYSTFLGGEGWDYAKCILTVGTDIYVGGFTHGMFPTTPGVAQPNFGGYGDGFLAKLHTTPTSTTLVFATYLGGYSWEGMEGIALDDAGNIYTTGGTHSTDFPTTPGAFDRVCDNCVTNFKTDGFITKFNPDASQFLYSTIVGSNTATFGTLAFGRVAVNDSGEAIAVGSVTYASMPITPDAFQLNYAGASDIAMVKIDATGSTLLYGTYFGGSGDDISYPGTALDPHGNMYIAGATSSIDFPTLNPIQATLSGGYDAFLAVFGPDNHLRFSTFWGGSQDEGYQQSTCANVAIDSLGNLYLIGSTLSPDFPTTPNAFDPTIDDADFNGFVTKFAVANMDGTPFFTSTPVMTATQDTPYTYTVTADDPDLINGDALTIVAPTLPTWLTLVDHGAGTATLAGTPINTDVGQNPIVLRVTDSVGLMDTQAFTLTVVTNTHTWHIAPHGSDVTGDGSEANPYAHIQHGIDTASHGDTVLVHPGVYQENINFNGKNIIVGSLIVTTGDENFILQTVIDGNRNGSVVKFVNGEDTTAMLSGFTIVNGYASGTSYPGDSGGGSFCLNSNPTLTHLKVSGNEAVGEGGGLYFAHCSSTVQDVIITNNLAGGGGGGIRYTDGVVSLENAVVTHNSALAGAGIHFYHSEGTIRNSLIADNSGGGKGGGMVFDGCSPTFINVTVVGNFTAGHGGGLNVSYMSHPILVNSIVWGNMPEQIYFDTQWPGEAVTIKYSDIQGGVAGIITNGQGPVYWGDGNLDTSPRFLHSGLSNYHLGDDSPCINAGQSASAPATDLEGNPRPAPVESNPDMGAYENPLGLPVVPLYLYLPLIFNRPY